MEKGFTLIELLAVILILGVIALIGVPVINSIIENVKEESFKTSMTNIIKAVEDTCEASSLKGEVASKKYIIENGISSEKINITGSLPDSGVISVDNNCKIYAYLSNNKYVIEKNKEDEKFRNSSRDALEKVMTKYENGTPVYFNPTVGKICKEEDALTAVGTKDGCMRWYIFNDEAGNDTVDMILEHNTVIKASYESCLLKLKEFNWVSGLNPRMIKLDEINKIISNHIPTASFDAIGEDGYGVYHFLYNYTFNNQGKVCTLSGCKYTSDDASQYWLDTKTASYETTTRIYVMTAGLIANRVKGSNGVGLRPVITIPKTILES